MFSITKEDLKKFEQIGTGKYGRVYRIDSDRVIKVYRDTIRNMAGEDVINPALQISKGRLRRIKNRAKKVNNSDLPSDIVVLDGYFYGYVLPYYDGKTLDDSRRLSYSEKKAIAKQLVDNDKELDDNFIYPLDYHTDNIMVVDDKVKIIDLDDPLTHYTRLPNIAFSKISMGRLNETIGDFYDELDLTLYGCYTMARLQRVRPGYSNKRDWLDEYLKEKEDIQDYLIINEDTDINLLRELLRNHRFRVLYSMRDINHDKTKTIVESFGEQYIGLFDFVLDDKQDEFFSDYPVRNKVLVKKDAIKL